MSKERKEKKSVIDRSKIKINPGPSKPNLVMSTEVGNGILTLDIDSGMLSYSQ